jgi:hypothetical protein
MEVTLSSTNFNKLIKVNGAILTFIFLRLSSRAVPLKIFERLRLRSARLQCHDARETAQDKKLPGKDGSLIT